MLVLDCPVYLASSSPRRKGILRSFLPNFYVLSVEVSEIIETSKSPEWITMKNAFRKLIEAKKQIQAETYLIITADTIVSIDQIILGKPSSREDAIQALIKLQDCTHQVYTGVVIEYKRNNFHKQILYSEKTDVTFHSLSVRDIESYVDSYKPFDKAGSYGIQELPKGFIQNICGDFDNVVGLPKQSLINAIQNLIKLEIVESKNGKEYPHY